MLERFKNVDLHPDKIDNPNGKIDVRAEVAACPAGQRRILLFAKFTCFANNVAGCFRGRKQGSR